MSEVGVQREVSTGSAPIDRPSGRRRGDRIVGAGRATQEVVELAIAASRSDRPVVISGPQGAGKDHLARAIHAWGPRASAPYVVVSTALVPEPQIGRELVGAAGAGEPGALERAAGGTLVLEDVDELRPDIRLALLRTLAEGSFRREGESSARSLSARIVAASSRPAPQDLGEMPHHEIRITPLRERREDILPLAAHYLASFAEEVGLRPAGFDADARAFLETEPWIGDSRELRGRIREALRLCGEAPVSAEALLLARDDVPSFKEAKRAFETRYVVGLLRRCGGNISRAARLARKDRKDFYDVIRRTGVDPASFRS